MAQLDREEVLRDRQAALAGETTLLRGYYVNKALWELDHPVTRYPYNQLVHAENYLDLTEATRGLIND